MEPRSLTVALEWLAQGRRVITATLVETLGSAPLEAGAEMLVDDTGRIEGSVTGGCVEGALVEESFGILAGAPARVATYGISDDQAVGVGLMCGGTVRVFVAELRDPEPLTAVAEDVTAGRPVALATLLDGPDAGAQLAVREDGVTGSLGADPLLATNVERDARGFLDEGSSAVRRYSARGETMGEDLRVAIRVWATAPRMVIFGAIDFSAAIAKAARAIGYRVTIVDARQAFAASDRFAADAEVVISWPQEYLINGGAGLGARDAVLVFTHDPKFDEPALLGALDTEAGYIGALGSRRTHGERLERLRAAGATDLDRISSPCGLDVGARTPAETAVAVLAEILALRAGRGGGRLAESDGPIHSRQSTHA